MKILNKILAKTPKVGYAASLLRRRRITIDASVVLVSDAARTVMAVQPGYLEDSG
ncbi:MAG: hypothetical protein HC889_16665 [Synechococcaceae cyanobacterium SM1_2_3]|nr:hypothetical protein [Synechococcaceae cyanobacterium SM1_2_3]